jgi:N-acetylglutamate synthase-like GNAT family acetyltransferase
LYTGISKTHFLMPTNHHIEIVDFYPEAKEAIKTLNYEWLEKYFHVEKGDAFSLSHPQEEIIDKGGFIFYATRNGEIVGTVALLKQTDHTFQLGKMAVAEKAQGHGIGTLLMEHGLAVAKQHAIQTLYLYSNTLLASAVHLYRKFGFVEIPLEQGVYDRANIKMEKKL